MGEEFTHWSLVSLINLCLAAVNYLTHVSVLSILSEWLPETQGFKTGVTTPKFNPQATTRQAFKWPWTGSLQVLGLASEVNCVSSQQVSRALLPHWNRDSLLRRRKGLEQGKSRLLLGCVSGRFEGMRATNAEGKDSQVG